MLVLLHVQHKLAMERDFLFYHEMKLSLYLHSCLLPSNYRHLKHYLSLADSCQIAAGDPLTGLLHRDLFGECLTV